MKETALLQSEKGFFVGDVFDVMNGEDCYEKWSKNLKKFTGEHELRGKHFITVLGTTTDFIPSVIPYELARADVQELKEKAETVHGITFLEGKFANVEFTKNHLFVDVNGKVKTLFSNAIERERCD